jgi:hypothetical protein
MIHECDPAPIRVSGGAVFMAPKCCMNLTAIMQALSLPNSKRLNLMQIF